MKHYHKILREEIMMHPEVVGDCFRMMDTPDGPVRRYFCKPTPLNLKPKPKTSRKSPRCSCGRLKKHCTTKGKGVCGCGEVNCI